MIYFPISDTSTLPYDCLHHRIECQCLYGLQNTHEIHVIHIEKLFNLLTKDLICQKYIYSKCELTKPNNMNQTNNRVIYFSLIIVKSSHLNIIFRILEQRIRQS